MTEEQQEEIGQLVDRLRSLIAGNELALPAQQKLDYTLKSLVEIQAQLRVMLVEDGVEDWWEGRSTELGSFGRKMGTA